MTTDNRNVVIAVIIATVIIIAFMMFFNTMAAVDNTTPRVDITPSTNNTGSQNKPQTKPDETPDATQNPPSAPQGDADIQLDTPGINDAINSPVVIKGEARGSWFFEASFPIEITDSTGKVLGQGTAQAQGDWMTNDFVPFTATITYQEPLTDPKGFIVFKKDNPSGLPENDKSIKIPITFDFSDREPL